MGLKKNYTIIFMNKGIYIYIYIQSDLQIRNMSDSS